MKPSERIREKSIKEFKESKPFNSAKIDHLYCLLNAILEYLDEKEEKGHSPDKFEICIY